MTERHFLYGGLSRLAIALVLAVPAIAIAQPSTGPWVGNTSQGKSLSFTVTSGGAAIQPLTISYTIPGCLSGTTTVSSTIPISGSTFSLDAGGICPHFSIQGKFNSATAASGSARFETTPIPYVCPCSATVNVTWTAGKSAGSADLAVTKTDGQDKAAPGSPITYTLTVTNKGPSAVGNLTLTDNVPAAIQNPVFTPAAGSYDRATGAWTGISLSTGQSVTMTMAGTLSASAAGTVVNTATVAPPAGFSDPDSSNNSATDTDTVSTDVDVSVTQTGPATVTPPSHLTYAIRVANAGPATAQGVDLQASPPAGLAFVGNAGACTTAFPCSLDTLVRGQEKVVYSTYSIPESYSGPSPFSHSVTVATVSPDTNPANQTASTSTARDAPGPTTLYHALTPCRVLDTRESTPLTAGGDRLVTVVGGACGVPATARAASLNLTVTSPTSPGDLRLYPVGSPLPLVSAINYASGQTRANNAVTPVGTGGQIGVHCDQAAGTVHFIVDVSGYFE
jgi:uncharacterized repeat protein (TIGR01451 family)